ncbi:MAG: molybdopterin molybdotransferase MoeA [Alterinioella nitratireducens]|uniref:molybdopterin molybdotransferase MoeA n=1 Tax=Alterinioella nitratireducens TaxID=2735915 RepID=UPI004057E3E4
MIPVSDALSACLDLCAPLETEEVPLAEAATRTLARAVTARRDQPPFASSAMDGYAVTEDDLIPGRSLRVVGEAAAGHHWAGRIGRGEAVRIFTGAPVPDGAAAVVIQEDVTRDGQRITLGRQLDDNRNIRAAGGDFRAGDSLSAPRRLRPADIALAASMNLPTLPVTRAPVVAIIATGDELVQPGEDPRPDQIIASNSYGLKAMVEAEGAEARLLPIARDTEESLGTVLKLAEGADIVVTIGGASVGDHDLVGKVALGAGLERSFYKVAMRPGKPLMAGRLGDAVLLGLPGNPVSSLVCGHVFLLLMIRAMLGLGRAPAPRSQAPLAVDLPENGPREHYMRARLDRTGHVKPFDRQDSALLTVLSEADVLMVRPAGQGSLKAGTLVDILRL